MSFGKKKDESFTTTPPSDISIIETGIEIIGEKIIGSSDIVVRGLVKCQIEADADVTVCHEGTVNGDISCINCTIQGHVVGNVSVTGHLTIADEGSVVGDISCSSLSVMSGANFVGSCNKPKEPVVVRTKVDTISIATGTENAISLINSIKLLDEEIE